MKLEAVGSEEFFRPEVPFNPSSGFVEARGARSATVVTFRAKSLAVAGLLAGQLSFGLAPFGSVTLGASVVVAPAAAARIGPEITSPASAAFEAKAARAAALFRFRPEAVSED